LLPERPRIFLDTKTTDSTEYAELLLVEISSNAKGLSYFVLSIDPDPNALYQIQIARLLTQNDLELTAIWTVSLPHLTSGVYEGFNAGDKIVVRHRSTNAAITVKSGISCEFNEVTVGK